MAEERKKLPLYTTPKGTAKWVTLGKPDTKYKKEGQYRVTMLLSPELAKPIQEMIDKAIEEEKKLYKADPKNKGKKIKDADLPYKMDLDKEGNETGLVSFNFTAKASGVRPDGTTWTFRPAVMDATGKGKVSPNISIFGGSILKVAYHISSWATAIGIGASLKLQAVQVIELKTMGDRDYGFGEEEGYTADGEDVPAAGEEAGSSETPPDDNQDF